MFGGTNRYTFQQLSHINQKDILNKQDLLQVVNYWCSVLDSASTCTDGKALHCSNRDQIHSLVKTTGGLCENGRIKEESESLIPETFTYDTKCEDYALDIIETCENNVPEIDYDVGIEDGVEEMMRNVAQVLRCNAKVLKESPDQCVSSRDSLLMYTFRTLSYSVPHALGVELNVSTVVMDIIAL
ncbi:uncharacterized protein LOC132756772 [Ruditapes philippinarum]|uniref:uncharacterized protein LOC132756772 n=1 Tax=Ruditapes philippinarum TaxID=129788 RepID=UPI00295C29E4|nr:uncharacterized protein LOC132756772 [Ruditapes philippinarum]